MLRNGMLAVGLLVLVNCSRNASPGEHAIDEKAQGMAGTWREQGAQEREYVLNADGTFSMKIDSSRCLDGAGTLTTASGTWSLRETSLVLHVQTTSDPIFADSTMQETIRQLDANTLVLESSVIVCAGQVVRLVKL